MAPIRPQPWPPAPRNNRIAPPHPPRPLLGFKVSGISFPSLLQAETKGDLMITGGDFGLEGSMLVMLLLLTAILILAWAFQRKYGAPALRPAK